MNIPTIDDLEILTPDQLGKLLLAEVSKIPPDFKYIQNLLDVGCPIDIRDEWGHTALHYAARDGKLDIVELLLSLGAEVEAMDGFGRTALHMAAMWGQIEVVKFLVSKGALVNTKDDINRLAWDMAPTYLREACPELEPK